MVKKRELVRNYAMPDSGVIFFMKLKKHPVFSECFLTQTNITRT